MEQTVGLSSNTETRICSLTIVSRPGASDYFKRTENVAGVKDMRFQALMPDVG